PGTTTGRLAPKGWRSWLPRPVRWLLTGLGFLGRLLLVTWATLAIYFSNLPWAWSRLGLAVVFAAVSAWAFGAHPTAADGLGVAGAVRRRGRLGGVHPPVAQPAVAGRDGGPPPGGDRRRSRAHHRRARLRLPQRGRLYRAARGP